MLTAPFQTICAPSSVCLLFLLTISQSLAQPAPDFFEGTLSVRGMVVDLEESMINQRKAMMLMTAEQMGISTDSLYQLGYRVDTMVIEQTWQINDRYLRVVSNGRDLNIDDFVDSVTTSGVLNAMPGLQDVNAGWTYCRKPLEVGPYEPWAEMTSDTKEVLGYSCESAELINSYDDESKVYFTRELPPFRHGNYAQVPGLVLFVEIPRSDGSRILIQVEAIDQQPLSPELFVPQQGWNEVSCDELGR